MFYVYTLTNKMNNRKYIGATSDLKRRLKEHKSAATDIGRDIRKFGIEKFTITFEILPTREAAFIREAELVSENEISSDEFYNRALGGKVARMPGDFNPMRDKTISSRHPNIWSSSNNPMNNPEQKKKMIQSQDTRAVSIAGKIYYGVREAARQNGMSRQKLVYRLKSDNFPDHFYL